MKYSAEQLSQAGDQYLGRSYDEMDCQTFIERCLKDIGLKIDLTGSNAWYREVMKNGWVGSPEECIKIFGSIPKGAFLFILEKDGKEPGKYQRDGIGNASHIGIKTGRGKGAIHSSGSRGCVAESEFHDKTIRNGGWNRVGLWSRMDYGTTINWHLEHGSQESGEERDDTAKKEEKMQGTLYAENGIDVNVRRGPGKSYPLIDRYPVGTPIEITGDHGEWYAIQIEGRKGYVMKLFVKTQKSEEEPEQEPSIPDEVKCTVTIYHLSKAAASTLAAQYEDVEIEEERG